MIELCTRRRMILAIVVLGLITVLVLILEEQLTSSSDYSPTPIPHRQNFSGGIKFSLKSSEASKPSIVGPLSSSSNLLEENAKKECWKDEGFKILEECTQCSQFEINSNTPAICGKTGLKEVVQCDISGQAYRSCTRVLQLEKQRFWIFESLMLLVAVLSFGFVKFRTSQLGRKTVRNIERQLASGH